MSTIKIQLNATAAPTVNDDITLGYVVGSFWHDTINDNSYVCVDNTDGVAVWKLITATTASQVGAHATGADIDAGGYKLKNFDADVLTDSNTSITLSATHRGKILHTTSASAVTVTIPDTCESGFTCTVRQEGAGQITFAAGSNMTLRNRQSHTKSAGQYSGVCVSVEGTGYVYIQGDTAA